jgi:hypothetical protein
VYDELILRKTHNSKIDDADGTAFETCARAAKLTAGLLVQAVEKKYADNLQYWDWPANVVLRSAALTICNTYVNHERQRIGENPVRD